jgi:hypothetical protein
MPPESSAIPSAEADPTAGILIRNPKSEISNYIHMTDSIPPTPPPPSSAPARTVRRILVEAAFVAVLGALVLGVFWEAGFYDVGWVFAAVIWAGGTPLLEILRVLQARG